MPEEVSDNPPVLFTLSFSSVVGGRSGVAAGAGPVGVVILPARLVGAFVGVRAEVVALGLQQVGWQLRAGVAVEEGQRRSHARHGDAVADGGGDDLAPVGKVLLQDVAEVRRGAEEVEVGVLRIGVADVAKEAAADDAAFAPQHGGRAVVDVPAVLFGGFADEHEALGVGDNFCREQGFA